MEIKLLEGFDEITFGTSMESFIEKLGQPDQQEIISDDEDPVTTVLLQYDSLQTSFFFEGKNEKYYLNSCDSNNEDCQLFGNTIFTKSPKELIELFQNMGFEKHETATEEWGEMRLSFENSMADFYFENRKLISVIWGY
ncbi:MAG: hypothetical protein JXR34_00770 [Bacteroidales bacterium]|nr:hypothetical protein [Bacteroidales bacterium]